jgi:hypothetical protein
MVRLETHNLQLEPFFKSKLDQIKILTFEILL